MAGARRWTVASGRAGGGGLFSALAASAAGHLVLLAAGLFLSAAAPPPPGIVEVFLWGRPGEEAGPHAAPAAGRSGGAQRAVGGSATKAGAAAFGTDAFADQGGAPSAAPPPAAPLQPAAEAEGARRLPRAVGQETFGLDRAAPLRQEEKEPQGTAPAGVFAPALAAPPVVLLKEPGEGVSQSGGRSEGTARAAPGGPAASGPAANASSAGMGRAAGPGRLEAAIGVPPTSKGDGAPGKRFLRAGAGPQGGGAGGPATGPLAALLREKIQSRIVYPDEAVRRGQEGEVLLRIRIDGRGYAAEIRIAKSSGVRLLDEAARRGVRNAAPLPSAPGWVEVPVRFFLR